MIRRRALLLAGCCLAMFVAPTSAPAEEAARDGVWPQWRGVGRDAKSASVGLSHDWEASPPTLLWKSEGMGRGYSSVSLDERFIYTTGNFPDGQMLVVASRENGEVAWKTPLTDEAPRHGYRGARCTPAIDGDRVYAVASSGAIVCLTTEGELLWRRDFVAEWGGKMMSGWGFSESPLVDGPWVLCTPGGSEALLVALDKLTGEVVWQSKAPSGEEYPKGNDGAAYSSIVVSRAAGVKQYVQLVGRGVVGVRASNGQLLWTYNPIANSTANIPTPLPIGDYVFTSTGYGTGSALLKIEPSGEGFAVRELYFKSGREFQNHHGGMIQLGRYLFAGHGHNNGFPICLDIETGEAAWGGNVRGVGSGSASVVYADGHLVFRYQSGVLALIEATPERYVLKGSFTPDYQEAESWAHPVIVDGRLYLREQDVLMCYDLRGKR